MHGDQVHAVVRLRDWKDRIQKLRSTSIKLQTKRDDLLLAHERATEEVTSLTASIERLSMTGELLRALMDKLVLDQVKAIEAIVTEGLRNIFFDQELSLVADVGQSRGKVSIDLLIKRVQGGMDIVGPPLDTMGGGVSSVASLALRILALMRLKKFPLLVLDETTSAISDVYVDSTGQFLSKLSETTGIPILLVTHNQSFLDHAKTAYQGYEEASEIGAVLALRKLREAK